MKSNKEFRNIGWDIIWTQKWFFKIFIAIFPIVFIYNLSHDFLISIFTNLGAVNLQELSRSYSSNPFNETPFLNITKHQLTQTFYASCILLIFSTFFQGILSFAYAKLKLKAIENSNEKLFSASFSSFKYSFDNTILYFLFSLKIFLWSLLFVIPGIIAFYKYRFAFLIKAENPELSPRQCLAESSNIIYGFKKQSFFLDFCQWRKTLLAASLFFCSFAIAPLANSRMLSFICLISSFASFMLLIIAFQSVGISQACLYSQLKLKQTPSSSSNAENP